MKKKFEVKEMTKEALEKSLSEKRTALRSFKFGISGSRVKNVKEGRNLKNDISRILTKLNNEK